jgi:eukaryotic-like serine/threonine-protein kinase
VHGRYAIYDAVKALGSGAAASVHLGVSRGHETVPVAIKRLHAGQARQAAAVARLLDEVRLSRHIVHPNVVRTIDFVSDGEEMLAVMEYVHGEPLSRLLADARESGRAPPVAIAVRIASDVLHGLHAAHVATDGAGSPLQLVHRDVTPENILVGADGVARLMDFGVAKAEGRLHATRDGGVRGKLAYLAPEQIGGEVTSRTDLYAVGLVLWEMLVGERAIAGENEGELLVKALEPQIPAPSTRNAEVPPALDAAIAQAIAKEPSHRFSDGTEQAEAFERAAPAAASPADVSEWVRVHGGERLAARAESVEAMLAAERDADPRGARAAALPSDGHAVVASTRPPRDRVQPWGLVAMVIVALGVLGIGLAWRALAVAPVLDAAAANTPPPPITAAMVEPTTPAVSVATPPTSVPSAEPPPVEPPLRRTVVPGQPSSRPRPGARAGTPSCDPPWTLDAKGIRRYDPACVK